MKNVKKILVLATMLSVLCALMCVNAFAAGGTIESIAPSNGATFDYGENATQFDMTYTAGQDGMFLVLVVKEGVNTNPEGKIAPKAEDILYVNQATSEDKKVSFTTATGNVIYPSDIESGSKVYLAGAGLDELTLMGTIKTPTPAGYTVSGNITSYLANDGQVTVELFKQGVGTATYTTTTTTGAYSIAEVENGTYTMKVSKYGHVTREYEVVVAGGAVAQDVRICLKGDVDEDGSVLFSDLQRLYLHLSTAENKLIGYALVIGDVDEDDSVLFSDLQRLYLHLSTAENKLF